MNHILRIIIGLIVLYLIACMAIIVLYYLDDDMDDLRYLPKYIIIPGIICISINVFAIVMLAAYIIGVIFIG